MAALQSGRDAALRVALLLHGPSGSGRATAARAAAAALGLHVVPFSCHELGGGPQQQPPQQQQGGEGTAVAALRAAFEAAAQFAPALLLLQDFEVLAEAAPGGGHAYAPAIHCLHVGTAAVQPGSHAFSSSYKFGCRHAYLPKKCKATFNGCGAHGSGGQPTAALRLAAALSACLAGAGPPDASCNNGSDSPNGSPTGGGVILVACTSSVEEVPAPLRRCFTHELAVDAPDQAARLRILQVRGSSSFVLNPVPNVKTSSWGAKFFVFWGSPTTKTIIENIRGKTHV